MRIYFRGLIIPAREEWLKSSKLVPIMRTLRDNGLLYRPADMVNFSYVFYEVGSVEFESDAHEVAVRIVLAIAKLPPFQRRLGNAYRREDFFDILGGGPNDTEKKKCSGQFHVYMANYSNIRDRLRVYAKKMGYDLDDVELFKWLFDNIVDGLAGLNLQGLLDGDLLVFFNFVRNTLMMILIQFLADGYTIMQVIRSAFNEVLPWDKITSTLPLAAYCFILPDQLRLTPGWCFPCTTAIYEEHIMGCKIQYFSLYACLLNDLIKGDCDRWRNCKYTLHDLRQCVEMYQRKHGFRPSPKKFKAWLSLIAKKTPMDIDQISWVIEH